MNKLILAVLVALAVVSTTTAKADDKPHYDVKDAVKLFAKFIKDYNRHYKDDADKEVHFEAFKKSLVEINKKNEEEPLATFDINQFADYTEEELKKLNGFIPPAKKP